MYRAMVAKNTFEDNIETVRMSSVKMWSNGVIRGANRILSSPLKAKNLCGVVNARNAASYDEDIPTHTGQKWDKDDYRMARFMDAPKHVNPQWAIKLIAEIPPQKTNKRVVWCDGGSGPEGHPRVYINLDKPGDHICGYCGLRFVKEDHHH